MLRTLKRRSNAVSRDASPSESVTIERVAQRQRTPSTSSQSSAHLSDLEDDVQSQAATQTSTLVKKLVRLALSTEYSRTPLRRNDISTKVFKDTQSIASSRSFKIVFAGAQKILRETFGMQMVELPSREKTSLKERRNQATQTTKAANASSKSWILVSVLPKEYKTNSVITQPSRAPSAETEAGYTAIYTFILALIYLNSGAVSEQKLQRYLKRVNADIFTPFGSTEKLLQRMTREGYVEKRRDTSSGEELVEWVVGPRGKIEVGTQGVAGLVKSVYGFGGSAPATNGQDVNSTEQEQDIDARLSRSLGVKIGQSQQQQETREESTAAPESQVARSETVRSDRVRPRRSGRRITARDDDDESDYAG